MRTRCAHSTSPNRWPLQSQSLLRVVADWICPQQQDLQLTESACLGACKNTQLNTHTHITYTHISTHTHTHTVVLIGCQLGTWPIKHWAEPQVKGLCVEACTHSICAYSAFLYFCTGVHIQVYNIFFQVCEWVLYVCACSAWPALQRVDPCVKWKPAWSLLLRLHTLRQDTLNWQEIMFDPAAGQRGCQLGFKPTYKNFLTYIFLPQFGISFLIPLHNFDSIFSDFSFLTWGGSSPHLLLPVWSPLCPGVPVGGTFCPGSHKAWRQQGSSDHLAGTKEKKSS